MTIRTIILGIGGCWAAICSAQDPSFHFNDASSVYFNPAFAGAERCPRLSFTYSRFRANIQNNFTTYTANYHQFVPKLKGGVGAYVMNDNGQATGYKNTEVAAMYAYELKTENRLSYRFAVQGAFHEGSNDLNDLGHRFDPYHEGALITVIQPLTKRHFDLTLGALAFSENFFAGLSVSKLNRPNECKDCAEYPDDKIPMNFTAQLGTVIAIDDRKSKYFIPGMIFNSQGSRFYDDLNNQYRVDPANNLTFQLSYKHDALKAGLGYRYHFAFPSSYIGHVGIDTKKLSVLYTLDYTSYIEKIPDPLSQGNNRTTTHQLSLIIPFECNQEKVSLCNCFD